MRWLGLALVALSCGRDISESGGGTFVRDCEDLCDDQDPDDLCGEYQACVDECVPALEGLSIECASCLVEASEGPVATEGTYPFGTPSCIDPDTSIAGVTDCPVECG
jgi:hypothetical protein